MSLQNPLSMLTLDTPLKTLIVYASGYESPAQCGPVLVLPCFAVSLHLMKKCCF